MKDGNDAHQDDRKHDRWPPGATILIRYVWRNRVWYAEPVTVVQDEPLGHVLFLRAGTPTKWTWVDFASGAFDGPHDHLWHSTDVLKLIEDGAAHAVWARWGVGDGPFLGWYIDLQDPLRRVPGGLVTWDRSLDIVVTPDLRWRWKDEDHFARLQELGWLTAAEAATIRAEGERVIERIEHCAPPFGEPWPHRRPDPTWPIPALPDDWAHVPPAGGAG